jgi:hypothetical protein
VIDASLETEADVISGAASGALSLPDSDAVLGARHHPPTEDMTGLA